MTENKGSRWLVAISGGVVGAALTGALLVAVAPRLIGEKLVREAIVAHPDILIEASDALRDRQYAPTLAAQRAAMAILAKM